MIRYCPHLSYAGPHHTYSTEPIIDQAPPARDPTHQIRGHGKGQPGRGWPTPGRGTGDSTRQQGSRGLAQACGGRGDHFYAFPERSEAKASDAIIKGIVPVCHRFASILFDPNSIYFYVFSYFSVEFVLLCDHIFVPVHVFIQVGDHLVVDWVYQSSFVSLDGYDTCIDMIIPDMVDFDVLR